MAITTDRIARIFGMLASINFAKMRDEFASASTSEKILAGENALEAALKIAAKFVPSMAIAENDLEILIPVLNVVAQVAVNGAPSLISRSQPRCDDPITGQLLDELVWHIRKNHPDIPDSDTISTSGVPRAADKAGDLCDDGPPKKPYHLPRAATRRQAVLIVEDEIPVWSTIAGYLRDAGYVVVEAANAAEALKVFASGEPVDVIFTDGQMPGARDRLMLARCQLIVSHLRRANAVRLNIEQS
jgi:Response regulator receiver domain